MYTKQKKYRWWLTSVLQHKVNVRACAERQCSVVRSIAYQSVNSVCYHTQRGLMIVTGRQQWDSMTFEVVCQTTRGISIVIIEVQ